MNRSDWNLLAICAGEGRPIGPAQLQKILFLLSENLTGLYDFYSFAPYHYGPFSRAVYDDAEELARRGAVSIGTAIGGYKQFYPTQTGMERAKQLESQLPDDTVRYVHEVVKWATSLSFPDLIRAIYQAFPAYRSQSIFRG